MFNPILSELVAREQHKDRLREAEQDRLVEASMAHQSAHCLDLGSSLGNLLIAIRCMFQALARAS
jgi:hypothetical protein